MSKENVSRIPRFSPTEAGGPPALVNAISGGLIVLMLILALFSTRVGGLNELLLKSLSGGVLSGSVIVAYYWAFSLGPGGPSHRPGAVMTLSCIFGLLAIVPQAWGDNFGHDAAFSSGSVATSCMLYALIVLGAWISRRGSVLRYEAAEDGPQKVAMSDAVLRMLGRSLALSLITCIVLRAGESLIGA